MDERHIVVMSFCLRPPHLAARQAPRHPPRHRARVATMTWSKVIKSLSVPDRWSLTVVGVDGDHVEELVCLQTPFRQVPEETATSVNNVIEDLLAQGDFMRAQA